MKCMPRRRLDSDELEFKKCLFNEPHSDIDTLSICSNCMKAVDSRETALRTATGKTGRLINKCTKLFRHYPD